MHIPEAKRAGKKVWQNQCDNSTGRVGNKAELEESRHIEYEGYHKEIGREITKLNGKSGYAEAHQIQGVVVVEQNDRKEDYKHTLFKSRSESEGVIKSESGN